MRLRTARLEKDGINLNVPTSISHLLTPWDGYLLYRTKRRRELLDIKPVVNGTKEKRVCKDIVYLQGLRLLCMKHGVQGGYLGLAAAHGAEIYTCLKGSVSGKFVTCQHKLEDYILIREYMRQVEPAYQGVRFDTLHSDILDALRWLPKNEKFAIGDLDMMCQLDYDVAERIATGWALHAEKKSVLAVWHTSNRQKDGGDKLIDKSYRPYLRHQLSKYFKIIEWEKWAYYERAEGRKGGFPMRVEVISLERTCKKASLAA